MLQEMCDFKLHCTICFEIIDLFFFCTEFALKIIVRKQNCELIFILLQMKPTNNPKEDQKLTIQKTLAYSDCSFRLEHKLHLQIAQQNKAKKMYKIDCHNTDKCIFNNIR